MYKMADTRITSLFTQLFLDFFFGSRGKKKSRPITTHASLNSKALTHKPSCMSIQGSLKTGSQVLVVKYISIIDPTEYETFGKEIKLVL